MQVELLGKAEEDFAATLYDGTMALPCTQEPAYRERSDICGTSQLLVRGVDFETLWTSFANGFGETHQDAGESLTSRLADQSYVVGKIPGQIIRRDEQHVFQQPRVVQRELSERGTVPHQHCTILQCFCTDEIRRQNR